MRNTESVLENQLQPVFSSLKNSLKEDQFILAYEPVWAIGTGITASLDQIADTHKKIREICSNFELNLSILYGGSVKVDNFQSIASTKNVSGGLVGGASLDAKNFSSLHNCLTDLVK
jgi:triosephosphate isomerase